MDAEFFCLNTQTESASQLVRYLNQYVDPTISLKVMDAHTQAWDVRAEIGRRYTKLMHASIPPERELNIEAVTQLELFGNRIYLRVYWPMLVDGYYWSPEYRGMVRGLYWTTYEQQFHGKGRGLELFLPALAIRDRMVLVPKGQNETLEGMGLNEPPRPPLQRGVIEADFADTAEMEEAFSKIGKELRRELRQELAAYKSFLASDQLDLDAAAAYLAVPVDMLRHALREDSNARELVYKQLRCNFEPNTVVKDIQTRVSLQIDNPSEVDLGEVRVQVRGPSSGMEINPERVRVELPAQARVHADFSVAATRAGDFALEVMFLERDIDAPRDLLPMQQLWISSVASAQ